MTEQLFNRNREPHVANYSTGKGKPARQWVGACSRCNGSGTYSFNGEHSRCYRCVEAGRSPWSEVYSENLYTLAQLDKMDATRAKKAAAKLAKEQAAAEVKVAAEEAARVARADMLAADPFFALLSKYADRSNFIADIRSKMRVRDLSEAQVAAAQAACDKLAEAEVSSWVGVVGERMAIDATVTEARCIYHADPSGWRGGRPDANRYLVKMTDTPGNALVWFTSSPLREGAHVVGTAGVKSHDEYKGLKQTIVTNVRRKKGTEE